MKKNKGFLLIDALFGFVIITIVCTLLYSSYIGLVQTYQKTNQLHMERVSQWED